jgi:hypothetical protein
METGTDHRLRPKPDTDLHKRTNHFKLPSQITGVQAFRGLGIIVGFKPIQGVKPPV